MVMAGCRVFADYDAQLERPERFVIEIFQAMWREREEAHRRDVAEAVAAERERCAAIARNAATPLVNPFADFAGSYPRAANDQDIRLGQAWNAACRHIANLIDWPQNPKTPVRDRGFRP